MVFRPTDGHLTENIKSLFAHKLVHEDYEKGSSLYWESDPANYVYGIERGLVKVVRSGFHGKEWIVRLASSRELLGTNDVLDHRVCCATALAVSDTTVWKIEAREFRSTLAREPELTAMLFGWMARLVRNLEDSLELFSNGKADERIANLLAQLSVPENGDKGGMRHIPFRLTRRDMADMVGVTPETCSRTLSEFKRRGMIEEDGNRRLRINRPMLRAFFRNVENQAGRPAGTS